MTTAQTENACCSSCAPAEGAALAIACTLGSGDFKERVADIRALAERALLRSERRPLQLCLTYAAEALNDVESLVAGEAECCAFLDFALRTDAEGVHLTITAPIEALAAADELFAHFAPELARQH